jgi:hypothetical protein
MKRKTEGSNILSDVSGSKYLCEHQKRRNTVLHVVLPLAQTETHSKATSCNSAFSWLPSGQVKHWLTAMTSLSPDE